MQSASRASRIRLDEALVERGLTPTRSNARALILAGDILVNDLVNLRAGHLVGAADALALVTKPRFVSRGGEKLDHALTRLGLDVSGRTAADFGASTGGFTDCLLQRGAARVYAIDVGYGQIDARLRADPRVVTMERANVRYLESLPQPVDVVTIDVSFISLGLVFPAVDRVLDSSGSCIALIKPQFEAGRKDVGKGGVVRDAAIHRRVLETVVGKAAVSEFELRGLVASPLLGPAGNVEFLGLFTRASVGTMPMDAMIAIDMAMEDASLLASGTGAA